MVITDLDRSASQLLVELADSSPKYVGHPGCSKNQLSENYPCWNVFGEWGASMQRTSAEGIAPFRPRVAKPRFDYLVRCLMRYALEHHADQVDGLPDDDLFLCMKSGIFRARQYGLEDFESIAMFVGLMLVTAPNFDEHEFIRLYLTEPTLQGVEKLDIVMVCTSDEVWQEVLEQHDDQAWSFGLTEENQLAECQDLNARMAILARLDDAQGIDAE